MQKLKVLVVVLGFLGGAILASAMPQTARASEKVFYIMGVELKGTTSVDKEPFPGRTLPQGDGFEIKGPKNGKWKVETYVFTPSQVVVRKGDRVTLNFVGINGAQHLVTIERYHPKRISVKRGLMKSVSFTADRAGRFQIKCFEHPPSMTGEVIVLDR